MAASSMNAVKPSTMFIRTKSPSSRASWISITPLKGHFPTLYSQNREIYWHDSNKYPDTFRISKGRL